jgi:hypothetical protein
MVVYSASVGPIEELEEKEYRNTRKAFGATVAPSKVSSRTRKDVQ